MQKQLSVIIPAYNEEKHIQNTLREVADYFSQRGYEFEIIIVNDGSTDDTAQAVLSLDGIFPQIKMIHRSKNLGKGETVKEGIRQARYPYCLFMDADSSTSIQEWEKFEEAFSKGARVVIGSRHLSGSRIVHPQPWIRRFLGSGYRILCRRLFGLRISDFNCGFKAYETSLAKSIYEQVIVADWTFDAEVFCLLKRADASIVEVPVSWEHRDKNSSIRPIRTALKTLKSIIRLKSRY